MGEKDSSIYYSVQSLKWIKSLANPSLADIALTQNNLAVVYNDIGNFIVADSLLLSSDKLARSVESYDILIKVLVNKSSGYERRGLLTEASNWADSAYYYANRYQDAVNIQGSLKIKKDIAEKLGDYKKALLIQTRINFLEDSLNTSNYINQLSILNVKNRVNEYNEEIIRQELKLSQQKVEISEQELKVKQRNYIMLVLGLITLLIFVIATFIYKQQKQKQKQLIEENQLKDQLARINLQNKLHEERLKISRDLHDNIGAQLTFIISSVDNMKHLFKSADEKLNSKLTDVANFSRTTITQLRDTIWALNKDEISFDDLKSRLYKYIETAKLAQEQTVFNFNVELTNNFHLNSIQGVSIYRVVQEAINNVMKYAAATNVSLNITETDTSLLMTIIDDGIGFNLAEIQMGNGLENMKNRASRINAKFTLNSMPEKGTEIILEIDKSEFS
jgi:signal transduction histidine kinase